MSGRLDGKVALVTGSARGIGAAIALQMATEGAVVHVVDLAEDAAASTAQGLVDHGLRAEGHGCDVSDSDAVAELVAGIGVVDVLVNNAGITKTGMLWKMSREDWDLVLRVNLTSQFVLLNAVAPGMIERKAGSVVNISSVGAIHGGIGQVNYVAAKAGVIGLTKGAALELARYGIRVNAIAPGTIETDMTRGVMEDERMRVKWVDSIPLQRIGQGTDVAHMAVFLASDESSFVTGQVHVVDGGSFT